MILIQGDEAHEAALSDADRGRLFAAFGALRGELVQAGVFLAGEALKPTSTATTVRVRNGKTLMTDGPFAETKEQLGGFYILNCNDLDEALGWAAKVPSAAYASVEVRPILEIPKG
jgi:hypothetical protein